ncbi:MAG: peptidylprolyl isomerase [Mycobacteriaceae bacterium]
MGSPFRRVPVFVALATAALVTLSGCGGSSSHGGSSTATPTASGAQTTDSSPPSNANLGGGFARATPLPSTVNCEYPASGQSAKPNTAPPTTAVSARGTVAVTLATSAGDIGLSLDRALAPCTVNSFLSLSKQSYFDNTRCHRLVTSGIYVLQCGDPSGTGKGGPGYVFANEYPTDQYAASDAALTKSVNYPAGTLATANTGKPNTNGSQFFLVFHDSPLPPQYTVFGTIDPPGLAAIEKVAAAGTEESGTAPGDGEPKTPVSISAVRLAG